MLSFRNKAGKCSETKWGFSVSVHLFLIPYLGSGIRFVVLFSCMCEAEWITCWQQRTAQISPHSKLQGGIPATPHEAPHQDNPQ